MAGWDSLKGDEDIMYADNVSFDGTNRGGKVTSNGQLLIGADSSPHIRVSTLTAGTGMTITNGEGSITLDASTATPLSFPTDSGTATPAANALTVSGGTMLNTSGSGATLTVNLDSTLMIQGINCFFWNLSFTLSGGDLVIAGADGTALSASNPAYVIMPSNATAGRLVLHTITANDTLDVSGMTGNTFGTTASVAWGNAMPWYVGGCADSSDANFEFVVSRLPHLQSTPSSSANMGDPSSATADQEYSVYFFNDVTEANYQSMQLGIIGSCTATKDGSDDWTIGALTDYDGVGRFNDNRTFGMPTGQNGAASGTYNVSTAGTDPVFTSQSINYSIDKAGNVVADISLISCSTPGTGANLYQPVLPLKNGNSSVGYGQITWVGKFIDNSAGGVVSLNAWLCATNAVSISSIIAHANATAFDVEDVDANDSFECHCQYKAQGTV